MLTALHVGIQLTAMPSFILHSGFERLTSFVEEQARHAKNN